MPFADAKYPPASAADRGEVMTCLFNARTHLRKAECVTLDALLGIVNHDPKEVMHVCAEAFRCIDVWVKRAEAALNGGE